MAIARRRKPEQRLQQTMQRGGGLKVATAHDIAHPLQRIVDDHRQMIGGWPFPAAKRNVAPGERRGAHALRRLALAEFAPGQRAGNLRQRPLQIQAPGGGFAGGEPRPRFLVGNRAAGPRMHRRAVGIARATAGGGDLAAGAEAGIDETRLIQTGEGAGVVVEVIALAAHGPVEGDAQPGQILLNARLIVSPRTREIGILDSQQQLAGMAFGRARIAKRGIGVSKMQTPVGRRREAKDVRTHDRRRLMRLG